MPWTEGFPHHIQDSTTMKTLIVLCSLATIAIAVPTSLRENIGTIDSSLEYVTDRKTREKKSPLLDISEERTLDDGEENMQTRHSYKTEVERPSSGKTKLRKPIIIKKKFGYQVFRDSDEEMAHADPNENCRKQFKVKLCDNELLVHTRSNNVKNLLSERSHEIMSDKDIGNTLKMAKTAVENLERSLQKKKHNLPEKSNLNEEFETDTSLRQDIAMAKSALEHIQKNMGNLESIEVQLNNAETKEIQHLKSINKWKEAIDTIHKNVETPKNMEDAFKLEKQNLHHLENLNVPKMSENERSDMQSEGTQMSLPNTKTVNEHNGEHEFSSKSTSSTKDEQDINDDDMFVSPTEQKESKMKLHSESLRSENILHKKASLDPDTKLLNLNTNDHVLTMKNSEILGADSGYKNIDMQEPAAKTAESTTMLHNDEKNMKSGSQPEDYNLKNTHMDLLALGAKSTENDESKKLTKESHIENAMTNDECNEEKHIHEPEVKSNEMLMDQNNAETKTLVNERHTIESEMTKHMEQKNTERLGQKTLDMDHLFPKMTLLTEEDAKDEKIDALDTNSLHQKHFKSLARENDFDNGKHDLTEAIDSHLSEANMHMSSLSAVNPREEHIPNEFSTMRLNEDHNMDHLHKENYETQDSHLKHSTHDNEYTSSTIHRDSNIDEQLNDFHKSFMRLAQEKQLNDILSQQTKINEFRNEWNPMEYMNARMHHGHNEGQKLHGNHGSRDLLSMSLTPNMRPIDHSTHQFKSEAEFHNYGNQLPTSMRLIEDQNVENVADELTEAQSLSNPKLAERWAHEIQQQDPHAFKTVSEFHNDMLIPMANNNGYHSGQHADKEQMDMRITEDQNLRQLFTDSHDQHEPHLMRWAQEKQHNDDLAQIFNNEGEFHSDSHMNGHLHAFHHPSVSNNRFNNNFDLNGNHDWSSMRSTTPDHFHIMQHGKSNTMDNAMQPSMHFPMRDTAIQMGHHHHHHHGLARSSYAPSLNNGGPVSDAVSVFNNANTGCGIPLLLSCSPSVVSGSLTRAQPMTMSAPAYRGADNSMYYMKRDANKIEGKQNVKIQKTPVSTTN